MYRMLPILIFFISLISFLLFLILEDLLLGASSIPQEKISFYMERTGRLFIAFSLSVVSGIVTYLLLWWNTRVKESEILAITESILKLDKDRLKKSYSKELSNLANASRRLVESYSYIKNQMNSKPRLKSLELGFDKYFSIERLNLISELDVAISSGVTSSIYEYTNFVYTEAGYVGILFGYKDGAILEENFRFWMDGLFSSIISYSNHEILFSILLENIRHRIPSDFYLCLYLISKDKTTFRYMNYRDVPLLIIKKNSIFALLNNESDRIEHNSQKIEMLESKIHFDEHLLIIGDHFFARRKIPFNEFFAKLESKIEKKEIPHSSSDIVQLIEDSAQKPTKKQVELEPIYSIVINRKQNIS